MPLDLDPHGSLTSYFKMNPDEVQDSVYNLLHYASHKQKNIVSEPYIVITEFDELSVLSALTAIGTLDRQVASMSGMDLVIATALEKDL